MSVKHLIQFLAIVALFEAVGKCQSVEPPSTIEQSRFAVEGIEIARPVGVPESVVEILRHDKYVSGCLNESQQPSEIPASWFVGSQVRLNGSRETDLIVMPRQLPLRANAPTDNACLYGAHVAPFWVFRETANKSILVLGLSAVGLEVLNTRSNGYRDIRLWSSTAVTQTTFIFHFDGHRYVEFKKRTESIK
jgi:hypothetical protein